MNAAVSISYTVRDSTLAEVLRNKTSGLKIGMVYSTEPQSGVEPKVRSSPLDAGF